MVSRVSVDALGIPLGVIDGVRNVWRRRSNEIAIHVAVQVAPLFAANEFNKNNAVRHQGGGCRGSDSA